MQYTYKPRGVCSQKMEVAVEDGKVTMLKVTGDAAAICSISKLVVGMDVHEAIDKMRGIRCGRRVPPAPDQLSIALSECIGRK